MTLLDLLTILHDVPYASDTERLPPPLILCDGREVRRAEYLPDLGAVVLSTDLSTATTPYRVTAH